MRKACGTRVVKGVASGSSFSGLVTGESELLGVNLISVYSMRRTKSQGGVQGCQSD